jgi:hypothetical protein
LGGTTGGFGGIGGAGGVGGKVVGLVFLDLRISRITKAKKIMTTAAVTATATIKPVLTSEPEEPVLVDVQVCPL